jgi:hypothetical protein
MKAGQTNRINTEGGRVIQELALLRNILNIFLESGLAFKSNGTTT